MLIEGALGVKEKAWPWCDQNALVSTGKGRPEVEGRGSEEGGLEGREAELAAEGGLVHERGVEGLGGSGFVIAGVFAGDKQGRGAGNGGGDLGAAGFQARNQVAPFALVETAGNDNRAPEEGVTFPRSRNRCVLLLADGVDAEAVHVGEEFLSDRVGEEMDERADGFRFQHTGDGARLEAFRKSVGNQLRVDFFDAAGDAFVFLGGGNAFCNGQRANGGRARREGGQAFLQIGAFRSRFQQR